MCTGDMIARAVPECAESPVPTCELHASADAFCSDKAFCIEVFARRASLCGCLRTVLPSSFAIGRGRSQAVAAPVVPIDVLSQGGSALCASWVREPLCAWVHIRCPSSMFPSRFKNSQPVSQEVERCIYTISQLLKHCRDANTQWTVRPFGPPTLAKRCHPLLLMLTWQTSLRV